MYDLAYLAIAISTAENVRGIDAFLGSRTEGVEIALGFAQGRFTSKNKLKKVKIKGVQIKLICVL